MKKKILTLFLFSVLSAAAITGCKQDDKPAAVNTENVETTETEPEGSTDTASKETMDSIPEGTNLIGPATDADGNLPENFEADEYYKGFAEQAKEQEAMEKEAEKENAKKDTKKDISEKSDPKKDTGTPEKK